MSAGATPTTAAAVEAIPWEQFVATMPDGSLAPNVPRSMRLIFERGGVPRPGYGVMVQDKTGRRCIGRYARGRSGAWIAQAINPAYTTLDSIADGVVVLAVMTGRYDSMVERSGVSQ